MVQHCLGGGGVVAVGNGDGLVPEPLKRGRCRLEARTREFLGNVGRAADWQQLGAEPGADYDHHDAIDPSAVEPMIATPSSPSNVVRVRDAPKLDIYQTYIGSLANPGYRDYAVAAAIVADRTVHDRVSFDINPSTRQVVQQLAARVTWPA